MANIKKEIESLRAKLARLEQEQKQAQEQEKALAAVQSQIDNLLKENGLTLEAYVRGNYAPISRIMTKLARENEKEKGASAPAKRAVKKKGASKKSRARGNKPARRISIPAGKYGNLPEAPDQVFEVKEKGPRPKALKAYAEEVGLEAFFAQCRLN